jgi:hypothetical protein
MLRGVVGKPAAFTVLAALVAWSLLSAAAVAGPVAFELRVSENANVTVDPNNPNVLQQAGSLTQHELFSMRDMPYIQLMNTSPGTTATIDRFTMTIGDLFNNQHHFDWGRLVDVSPGMTVQFLMPDAVAGGVRSDAIEMVFTGFTPGKLVRIQTDIDNDQGNVDIFTDFRQILFDLGGNTTTDNSFVTVTFSEPGLPATVVPTFLPDFPQLGPTNVGYRLISECGPESVQPYVDSGNGIVVPEPGTLALLACGLLGFVGFSCRRRERRS